MGIGRALRLMRGVEDSTATAAAIGGGDVAQVSDLPAAVAQAFGINTDSDSVTRAEAMTVPAMRRARMVIAGTLGALPLTATRPDGKGGVERVPDNHPTVRLIEQPDPNLTRAHVLTRTLDDLIFYPVSWWKVIDRDGETGYPLSAEHVALHRVRVDLTERRVYVDGRPVDDRDLIRFDGPDEGVLTHGARTLRTCLRLEDAVRRMATLDVPLGVFTPAEGAEELSDTEIDDLLDAWTTARRTGNWAYLNRAVTAEPFRFDARTLQLEELRQYQTAEVARLVNLPPRLVNAPAASSMTYTNVASDRLELVDLALSPYIAAVEQRLSMPDVTPRGHRVAFDLGAFLSGTVRDRLEAAAVGIGARVITADEVRVEWLKRAPLPEGAFPDPPAPAVEETP